ncbi:MAG: hypothetical protein AB1757_10105 [Acidobacteriota bacterium]
MSLSVTQSPDTTESKSIWQLPDYLLSDRLLFIALFLFAIVLFLAYRPFSQIVIGDTAFYDYIAQSILRGQLPYRDTVDIKFPGGAYLSAFAMLIGKLFGLRDVLAVRVLYLLLAGIFCALIFLVGRVYLSSRIAGILAALMPLTLTRFGEWIATGTEPKLPLMIGGLLTLLMIAKRRPFWAGFCGTVACLFWQPGLMFVGVAFLIFTKYLTAWRDGNGVKVMLGALMPLAVVVLYFGAKGALGDLWAWTMTYNYSVFGPDAKRTIPDALAHIWKIVERVFQNRIAFVPLSIIGLGVYGFEVLRNKRPFRQSLQSPELYRDALLMPPLIYFAFSLINFQAGADLLPFLPFICIFSGYVIVLLIRKFSNFKIATLGKDQLPNRVAAGAVGLMVLLALLTSARYRMQTGTIGDQDKAFATVAENLNSGDKIYVHGTTELLVLLNRPNLNAYLFLDWGADEFAAFRQGKPFSELIAEMERATPKIVALSRLKVVRHRDDFLQWVEEHYTPLKVPGYDGIYIRKP